VNKGASILLRLRPPQNRNIFYPFEFILGTMIHELTHMDIGIMAQLLVLLILRIRVNLLMSHFS
jgi:hypothetical protein